MSGGGGNAYANPLAQNVQGAGTQAGLTYSGMQQGQGPLATTDLSPYMNPYTKSVIDPTMAEMNRQEQLQSNNLASQATSQGAFGGDRFAIQQAENNRNFDAQRALTLAGLNQQNFGQAQNAAQSDIATRMAAASGLGNMANMGFGWGDTLNKNQLAAGALQQNQQQNIMDAIKSQFQGFANQGVSGLANAIAAIQGMGGNMMTSKSSGSTSGKGMNVGL